MTERVPAEVFPPGDFLREEMDARGWDIRYVAAEARIPVPLLCALLLGQEPLTGSVANKLADLTGISRQMWLNLEASYRAGAPCSDVPLAAPKEYKRHYMVSVMAGMQFGRPCVDGTRLLVETVLNYLIANGMEDTCEDYDIHRGQVLACVFFASEFGTRKQRRLWKPWVEANWDALWHARYDEAGDPPVA
jgi:plasmid maintenance system antidote protein VapI/uncharacterized protein (DUF433 family)